MGGEPERERPKNVGGTDEGVTSGGGRLRRTEIPSPGGGLIQLVYVVHLFLITLTHTHTHSLSLSLQICLDLLSTEPAAPFGDAWTITIGYYISMYLQHAGKAIKKLLQWSLSNLKLKTPLNSFFPTVDTGNRPSRSSMAALAVHTLRPFPYSQISCIYT
jgi:hypothetical protein